MVVCLLALIVISTSIGNTEENGVFNCSSNDGVGRVNEFRCTIGTCILMKNVCDGFPNCPDASDEEFCKYERIRSKRATSCVLPPYPNHGTYDVQNRPTAATGESYDSILLTVRCRRGYGVVNKDGSSGDSTKIFCVRGDWDQDMPECVQDLIIHRDIWNGERDFDYDRLPQRRRLSIQCMDYIHSLNYPCKRRDLDVINQCSLKVYNYSSDMGTGRRKALRNEFPHMALLGFADDYDVNSWQCGGSVVSERFVLTSAHCLYAPALGPVKYVALGILKRSDPVDTWQRYDVKRAIPHPKYVPPKKYHDIGLLETERQIRFSKSVLPACLHTDDNEDNYGYFTGWGIPNFYESPSDNLNSIYQIRFDEKECDKQYPASRTLRFGIDHSTQMCFGETNGTKGTCQGDSGGPLQTQTHEQCVYTIIGILSYGRSCSVPGDSSVYTRVKYYVPWIEQIVCP